MSRIAFNGNALGTGTVTIASPNTNSDRTVTLPDETGTVVLGGGALGTPSSGNGTNITNLNASNLATGTVPTARLATGTADSTTYLRGDSTWATVTAGIAAQNCSYTGTVVESANFNLLNTNTTIDLGSNRVVTGMRIRYIDCQSSAYLRGYNIKNTAT
jgi:hypothetical protein